MSINLTVNGIVYPFPQTGDEQWGDNVTNWAIGITNGVLQKSGGAFPLLAEVDFGGSFGIKAQYIKSRTSNVASTGSVRLANVDSLSFRNSGNTGDLAFKPGSSDSIPQYNSLDLVNVSTAQSLSNKTLVGAVFTGGTLNSPTINTPTVVGGSFSSPTINNPTITGTATFVDLSTSGTTTLGDASSDTIVLNARFASSMIPSITATDDIGSGSLKWKDLYLSGQVNTATLLASGNTTLQGDLSVSGTTTLDTSLTGVVKAVSGVLSAGALVNADVSASAAIAYSKLNLTGTIVNADVNASAAIAYSKLNLAGSILNADINASAAIAYSKLNLALSIVNADINASAAIAYSKLNLSNSILNADINASAAIAYSKLNLTNTILNADINASAAIAYSKLNLALSIVNADVSTSAAIAGTKISPNFGSQNIINSGNINLLTQSEVRFEDAAGGQYVGFKAPATVTTGTYTLPPAFPGSSQVLQSDSSGVLSWTSTGLGDVVGPAGATNLAIARFDGVTGKLLKNSIATMSDLGAILATGSVSLPAYAFVGDPDTGIYPLAANQIGLASAGVKIASFDDAGQARFGTAQAGNRTHGFFKDVNAGDSTDQVQVLVGNSGGAQGTTAIQYNNRAAASTPSAVWLFDPRLNNDSGDYVAGSLQFAKGGATNTSSLSLNLYENAAGAGSFATFLFNGTVPTLQLGSTAFGTTFDIANAAAAGSLRIFGSANATGGGLTVYSSSHATNANQTVFRNNSDTSAVIDDSNQWSFGTPNAGIRTHGFYKDASAAATAALILNIGNSNSQGKMQFQWNNAVSTGLPSAWWKFTPMNNAGTVEYTAGSFQFQKAAASNSSVLDLQLYENTAGAGSFVVQGFFNGAVPTVMYNPNGTFTTGIDITQGVSTGTLRLNATLNYAGGGITLFGATHSTGPKWISFGNSSIEYGYFNDSGHLNLVTQHELRFQDAAGGDYVGFKAPATATSGTYTLPDAIPGSTKILQSDSSGVLSWVTGGGSGNVTGPGSSVDNTLPRFDGVSGVLLQGSGVVVDDSNNVSGVVNLTLTGNIDAGFVQEPLTSATLTDNATATFLTLVAATYTNVVIDYSIKRDTGRDTGTLYVVHDGSTAEVSVSSVSMGDVGTSFSADISGGNLRVRYTTTNTGISGTLKFSAKKWFT